MPINSIYNSYNARFRLSGLATGLDTDQIVMNMMRVERMPIDRLVQKKQLSEWRRDDYRSITNLLRDMKDNFFDVLKPSTYMLSQNSYKKYSGTSTDPTIVTVTGSPESSAGSNTITVYNLATASKAVSSGKVTAPLEGNAVSNYELAGKKIKINLDGVTREITLDNYSFEEGDIVNKAGTGLQALVDKAFGAGKILVNYNKTTQRLSFETAEGASRITLYNVESGGGLGGLGFSQGSSNRLNIYESLDALKDKLANNLTFNSEGKLKFTINSKEFTFDKSTTLASMMNTINSDSTAKVSMQYDETSDKFIITAKQLGKGDNIVIGSQADSGNFFGAGGASGINSGYAITTEGQDAKVRIGTEELIRSSNTFTVNGFTYTLLKAHSDPSTQSEKVSLSVDVDGIYDNIKSFVDKYNEVIAEINKKLGEKYDKTYQPLTSEQKEAMKEDDIKKWEEKAKVGLLRNDSVLQNIVYDMRRALTDMVKGVSENLSSIGITTGAYFEKGKLIIDEAKLKDAIRNDPDAVMNLFSKRSSVEKNIDISAEQRQKRYEEEGLAWRLFDIVENNIRTVRDADGRKGILLEKAGIEGDASEFTNMIYKDINDYDKRINEMYERLIQKENQYYQKFASLEKMISQMNSQGDWLAAQLGQR